MNVGEWLKPGKRVKRQLSISGPLNFQHIEHIGAEDVVTNNKKLSSSFQNIAELCRALARHSTSDAQQPSSQRCSRTSSVTSSPGALTSEADLFNEITNCLAPELKSFLITDSPETSEKDEEEGPSPAPAEDEMGCGSSSTNSNPSAQYVVPNHVTSTLSGPVIPIVQAVTKSPVTKGPEKPTRKHKTLRKVSDGKKNHQDLISDIIKTQNHLKVEGPYNGADKENFSNNLPPPITPRTAKKLKLKDDMFRDMISKYCSKENPSSRLREVKKLGQGSSGVVMLVHDAVTDSRLAVKKMNLHRQQKRDLLVNEVSVGSLQHPNIVQTFSTHLVGEELWVLMEPLDGGSLTQIVENLHISKLTERHMARIALGAVSALKYLHALGVVHRDVKSDSILLSLTGQVKLSDFGYCDRITSEKPTCSGLIGTPHWMSPEIVTRKPYGSMTDVWSLGIMMIEMLDGEPPNFSDSQIVAMDKIKVNPSPSPAKTEISSAMLSFLNCCLKLEPELRSTAADLLQHRLFSDVASQQELSSLIREFYAKFKTSPVLK